MRISFILALLTLCVGPACLHAQPKDLAFEQFTPEDGLTHDYATAVIQDHLGFLWIGTYAGLIKYDGYAFTSYKPDPVDPYRLKDRHVYTLLEDHGGDIWVGTIRGGLSRFDRETERFTNYEPDPDDPNSLSASWVMGIVEDEPGVLFIATFGGGLNRLDASTGRFTHYRHDPANPNSLRSDTLICLYKDRKGILWIGSAGGLHRFDREQGTFTRFVHDPREPSSLSADAVSAILEDRAGRLWVGAGGHWWLSSRAGGLNLLDRETGRFTHFRHDPDDSTGIGSDHVSSLFEDREGRLWVGHFDGVLDRMDQASRRFMRYRHDPGNPASFPGGGWWISSILEDRSGVLWIGTGGRYLIKGDRARTRFRHYTNREMTSPGASDVTAISARGDDGATLWVGTMSGLMQFDRSLGGLVQYRNGVPGSDSLLNRPINALHEDKEGKLWIGTPEADLYRLDNRSGQLKHFRHDPERTESLCGGSVNSIIEDHQGVLWIGSWEGLTRVDRQSGAVRCYRQEDDLGKVYYPNTIAVLYEAPSEPGVLWIGTNVGGLHRFDTRTAHFTSHFHVSGITTVRSIYEDRSGRLWIGTVAEGLHLFDQQTGTSRRYDEQDGLANDFVVGILEDGQGRLWLSTLRALSRFDPENGTFKNYDADNGLHLRTRDADEVALRSSDGEMFFGGTNGLTAFFPEHIQGNPYPPQVALTGFRLFDQPVVPGPNAPLRRHVSTADEIRLSHGQNDLSFDFVALHYEQPERNRYAYMLEGYDETWREAGTQRTATYTNLSPGAYVYRVKAANADGLWNEAGASIHVTILPPWWRTWWAYVLYGLLLAATVFGVDRTQRSRLIGRERMRAEREAEKLRAEAAEAWANYLQSENKRQTQELDQARALQLSMLPECVPEHPTVEIAAYIKTATEVGGDYYDFDLSGDGTLTIIIGDATGHGASAGTMVTATKGILNVLAGEEDLEQVLMAASEAVRRMHLPKLYMALALVRLRDHTMELAGAGMPPALVYRAASGCIEEVTLKGMPLGSPGVYPYRRQCVLLAPGDSVLLMSDGLPELLGESGERLGYERMPELFAATAGRSPEEVIGHLMKAAKAWCNGQGPDDDMTFIVMKVKV